MGGAADEKSHTSGDEVPELDHRGGHGVGLHRQQIPLAQVSQHQQCHQTKQSDGGSHDYLQAVGGAVLGERRVRCPGGLGCIRGPTLGSESDTGGGSAGDPRGAASRLQFMGRGFRRCLSLGSCVANKICTEKVAEDGRRRGAYDDIDVPGRLSGTAGTEYAVSGLKQKYQP